MTLRLDSVDPVDARVGYGRLGVRGDLGYEGKRVTVGGRPIDSALSAHAPARLLYRLRRRCATFRCHVAMNDDVPADQSHAHFSVLADGHMVAHEAYVRAGEPPRLVTADVTGAELLELVVTTGRWEWCHAVWVAPEVDGEEAAARSSTLVDCLGPAEIDLPAPQPAPRRVIATVASAGFDALLDDLLGSIGANSGCPDVRLAVFALGDDAACARVAAKYRAPLIPCQPRARLNPLSKAGLYSLARVIGAPSFIFLDA